MKFLRVTGDNFVFHLSTRDKRLLFSLLERYPLLDAEHHRATRSPDPKLQASQELVAEAMEEVRSRHKEQIDLIVRDERWLNQNQQGYQFTLSAYQIDWLLQVLNDIRVGSWIRLGCPEEYERRMLDVTKENLRHLSTLQLSGYFQEVLLHALDQRSSGKP